MPISDFSTDDQGASDDTESPVFLHPSHLVGFESLAGSASAEAMADRKGAVDDVGDFPT